MPYDLTNRHYLSTEQAAHHCGFSPRTFEKYRVTGEGPPYIKRGRKVLYSVIDCEEWMQAGIRHSTTNCPGDR